jgi:hypothetical protein
LAGRVVDEAVAGKGWWAAVGRALVAEMRGGFGGTKGKRLVMRWWRASLQGKR